jgi:hypothetical protein
LGVRLGRFLGGGRTPQGPGMCATSCEFMGKAVMRLPMMRRSCDGRSRADEYRLLARLRSLASLIDLTPPRRVYYIIPFICIRCVDSPKHRERHVRSLSELGNIRKGRSCRFPFVFASLLSDLEWGQKSSFLLRAFFYCRQYLVTNYLGIVS